MSIGSSVNWRFMRKYSLISFIGGSLLAIAIYFSCNFVSESHEKIYQNVSLLISAGFLWCICLWRSLRSAYILEILAVAAGFTWGFLFSLTGAISIQNGRVSVWWPTMIPGLLLIPLIATVTVLPFWYYGKKRHNAA